MKPIKFLGDSLKAISEFPKDARQSAGYQLRRVQDGLLPDDFKPLPDIGRGVHEIRIWVAAGTYRVMYTARFEDRVYVLHAFQKKTQQLPLAEKEIAIRRYKQLVRGHL